MNTNNFSKTSHETTQYSISICTCCLQHCLLSNLEVIQINYVNNNHPLIITASWPQMFCNIDYTVRIQEKQKIIPKDDWRCMPSLEYLTSVIRIEFLIAMGVKMSRWPCVLQSCLYILRSNWPDFWQLCRLTTFSPCMIKKLIAHTHSTSKNVNQDSILWSALQWSWLKMLRYGTE